MRILTLILAAALSLATRLPAATVTNGAFQVGEKLTYNLNWGPLTVGRATLEVKAIEQVDGRDCYHLIAQARTTGLGDLLYTVRSTSESWLDIQTLCTRKYLEDRTEGKERHRDEIHYDYDRKQTVIKNRLTDKEETLPLDGPVLDVLSLVYAVRLQSLKLDSEIAFTANDGRKDYKVAIKPDERKEMKIPGGSKVSALRAEPNPTLKLVARNKGRAWFWMSEDDRRLPLLAVSKMAIGSARLELIKIEPLLPEVEKTAEKKQPKTNIVPGRKLSE